MTAYEFKFIPGLKEKEKRELFKIAGFCYDESSKGLTVTDAVQALKLVETRLVIGPTYHTIMH